MKIPCDIKAPCTDDSNPFINLSAEAPDQNLFFAYGSGPGSILPGRSTGPGSVGPNPGQNWDASCQSPQGVITCSATTFEEAVLCVQRLGQECTVPGVPPTNPPHSPTDPDSPPDPSSPTGDPLFFNTLQQCTGLCTDGTAFIFQVAAGLFVASSQDVADREAHSYACRQAQLLKVCFGTLSPTSACLNTPYSGRVTVSGGGNFTFTVASGSLPSGITLSSNGNTALLFGTPTSAGNFTFTLRAVSASGAAIQKSFTISVLGITNTNPLPTFTPNTPYSQQLNAMGGVPPYSFMLVAGSLPTGLTLSDTGLISGTPTSSSNTNFTVSVTDSA